MTNVETASTWRFRSRKADCSSAGSVVQVEDGLAQIQVRPDGLLLQTFVTTFEEAGSFSPLTQKRHTFYSFASGESVVCQRPAGNLHDLLILDYWRTLPQIVYWVNGVHGPLGTTDIDARSRDVVDLGNGLRRTRMTVGDTRVECTTERADESSAGRLVAVEAAQANGNRSSISLHYAKGELEPGLVVVRVADPGNCSIESTVWSRVENRACAEFDTTIVEQGAEVIDARAPSSNLRSWTLDRTIDIAEALQTPAPARGREPTSTHAFAAAAESVPPLRENVDRLWATSTTIALLLAVVIVLGHMRKREGAIS
jgi:hypothetical protein